MSDIPLRWLHRLLRWSEKYTKTDMVYLARGGFWLAVGGAVVSLSALAVAIAFANLVPPQTYGTYKYLLSIATIFSVFSLPGMSTAVARAVARGEESVIHTATRARVAASLIGSAVALLGSGYYLLNDNVELSLALLVIATTLPIFDTFSLNLAYFVGKRRFDLQTGHIALTQAFSVPVLIATVILTDSVSTILLGYFIPLSLARLYLYLHTARAIPKGEAPAAKETVTYGTQLTALSFLSTIAQNIDKVLLWKFLGPVELAVYTFALAIPEQVKGPLKSIGELSFPKFAAQDTQRMPATISSLWRKLWFYAAGLLVISLAYILAAPLIFKLLFPQYMDAVLYSQIFSLSLVTAVGSVLANLLAAQKKVRTQYILSTAQPVITIALFAALIPFYGIWGAIAAFMASRFITVGAYLVAVATASWSPSRS